MNTNNLERISKIKKVSLLLKWLFTFNLYLIRFIGFAGVIIVLADGDFTFVINKITLESQWIIISVILISTYSFQKIIYHFRQLLGFFSSGDIFNTQAIIELRQALFTGYTFFGILFLISAVTSIQQFFIGSSGHITLDFLSYIPPLTIFALFNILLWSLEIGSNLNTETELTI